MHCLCTMYFFVWIEEPCHDLIYFRCCFQVYDACSFQALPLFRFFFSLLRTIQKYLKLRPDTQSRFQYCFIFSGDAAWFLTRTHSLSFFPRALSSSLCRRLLFNLDTLSVFAAPRCFIIRKPNPISTRDFKVVPAHKGYLAKAQRRRPWLLGHYNSLLTIVEHRRKRLLTCESRSTILEGPIGTRRGRKTYADTTTAETRRAPLLENN